MPSVFKSNGSNEIGTVSTIVYTAPAGSQVTVIGMSVANVVATSVLVTATLTKGSTVTNIIKQSPVPTGSSAVLVGGNQKLVLEAGNTVSVLSNTASSVDCIVSVLEIT